MDEPFADEMEFVQEDEDPLADLSFPIEIRGSVVERDDIHGYTISWQESLGGTAQVKFLAEGDTARIISDVDEVDEALQQRLVDVLSDLGFETMLWPTGDSGDEQP
jgi:hypothetical protein